jgi:hypothetical protein
MQNLWFSFYLNYYFYRFYVVKASFTPFTFMFFASTKLMQARRKSDKSITSVKAPFKDFGKHCLPKENVDASEKQQAFIAFT